MNLIRTHASLFALWIALGGCVAVDIGRDIAENRPPKPKIDDEKNPVIVIETDEGSMTAELYEREVKNITAYFIYLIENNAYNGLAFYKADEKAVDAGPRARPLGFRIRTECASRGHAKYALSIKGSADGYLTADFMIMRQDAFDLDKGNTVVGRITGGKRTLSRIKRNDTIKRMYVTRKKSHSYVPVVESDGRILTREP